MEPSQKTKNRSRLTVSLLVISVWLLYTPPGIDGKLHAVGYSVCHQIESHTLEVGDRLLPLCARCTGTFLGLIFSLAYLRSSGHPSEFPSKAKSAVLIGFSLLFAADGINSALPLLPGMTSVYPPDNRLRLATGLLFGIALANLVLPLWQQTLWKTTSPVPSLSSWKKFIILVTTNLLVGILVLSNISYLYYLIAVLSTLSIFVVLTIIYSLLWCILLKKENSLQQYRDGIRILIVGMITAIIQIGLMDLLRYWLTGTWNSLQF